MLIKFECPHCRGKMECEARDAGARIPCPHCRRALTIPNMDVGPGCTVGGLYIEKLLGKGGMGEVFLARQLSLDRDVALKILAPSLSTRKEDVQRFLNEIHLLARLQHPNIVPVYEAGQDGALVYYAMAYVRGESLQERIDRKCCLQEQEALMVIEKLSSALEYAWAEHRVLHRDIKPANILLDAKGEPHLVDLGVAKSLSDTATLTTSGAVMGTPNYMSPEQAAGDPHLDQRSDMYALGATLYHAVTGQLPFQANTLLDVVRKMAIESLPDPREFCPSTSEACTLLIEVMMARPPQRRHDTWDALRSDVTRALAGHHPSRPRPPGGQSAVALRSGPRHPIVIRHGAVRKVPGQAPGSAPHPSRTPFVIGFGVAALAAAVALLLLDRQRPVPVSPPPALPPQTAAPAQSPPETSPLLARYNEALRHALSHPEDVDGAIARFEELRGQAAGSAVEPRVLEQLQRLADVRHKAVYDAVAAMRAEADRLLTEGQTEEAIVLLVTPREPYAEDIAAATADLLQQIRQRQADEDRRRQAEQEAALRAQARSLAAEETRRREAAAAKLAEELDRLADDLLRQDFQAAQARWAAAVEEQALAPVRDVVSSVTTDMASLASMPNLILASFERDVGETVRLELRQREALSVQVLGTEGGRILVRHAMDGASVDLNISLSELSIAEKLRRLGDEPTPAIQLIRGLLSLQAWDRPAAERAFSAGGPIGEAILRGIARRESDQREAGARRALAELLKKAGLTNEFADPGQALDVVESRGYAQGEAEAIRQSARDFQTQYGDSNTAKSNAALIRALADTNALPAPPPAPAF